MHDAESVIGHREPAGQALVAVHQVLVVEGSALFDQRIDHVYLAAEGDFIGDELLHPQARSIGPVHGADGFPTRRQLVDDAHIEVAIGRHGQGAGNGRGRHDQNMRRRLPFRPQLRPLLHPKPVLLIDYGQPQRLEFHPRLNERVRADQDVDIPTRQAFEDGLAIGRFHRAGQEFDAHIHLGQQLLESEVVLRCQDLGRRHDASLEAVVDREQGGQQGHHGLAAAHVPLEQAVHVPARVRIGANLAHHPLLGAREFEGQVVGVEGVEPVTDRGEADAGLPHRGHLLFANEQQLQVKELLEFQAVARLVGRRGIRWRVDGAEGRVPAGHLEFREEVRGERFGDFELVLAQNRADQPRDARRTQPAVRQLLRGRVNRLQPQSLARLERIQPLHLRVGDVPLAAKARRLAEHHHLLVHRQLSHNPAAALEPNQLQHPRGVLKLRHNALAPLARHLGDLRDDALQLDGRRVRLDFGHLHEARPVFVPKRYVLDQISRRVYAQFSPQKIRALGPHPFHKLNRRIQLNRRHRGCKFARKQHSRPKSERLRKSSYLWAVRPAS